MPKALTESQVNQFRNDGFLFPYDVYTPEEAEALYDKYAALEDTLGEEPQNRSASRPNCHSLGCAMWCDTRNCLTL